MSGNFLEILASYAANILPAFLVGIALAYELEKFLHPKSLKKILQRATFGKEVVVQVLGMISPLSIMSMLPLSKELVNAGVNPSLLFSFFIAERAYDLQSFAIISALFGVKFAALNFIAIFLSLVASAYLVSHSRIVFHKTKKNKKHESFGTRQSKLLIIVLIGIVIGAAIRTAFPEYLVQKNAGGFGNGIAAALVLGFASYFGPVVANYPIAKAFADLGMSRAGVFTFLTISPLCNFIVILLLSATVGLRNTVRAITVYSLSALFLSAVFSWIYL